MVLMVLLATKGMLVSQTVPSLINYQGQFQNPNGTTPPTADYELTVNVYDAATGGTLIWGPQRFNGQSGPGLAAKVPVVLGYFNLTLGPQDTAARNLAAAFDGSVRYVELRVGTNPPIVPRQQLLSAPFALRAASAGNADKLAGQDWNAFFNNGDPVTGTISGARISDSTLTGSKLATGQVGNRELGSQAVTDSKLAAGIAVPVGGVIMWWGTTASVPANYEICDGEAPVTVGATLVGNKPDLRDRFVKGAQAGVTDVKGSPVAGGAHFLDLRHNHEMDHVHGSDGLWVPISGGPRNAIWFGEIGGGAGYARGVVGPGYGLVIGPNRGTSGEEQQGVKPGTAVFGATANASRAYTASENPGFGSTDNRPAFLEMLHIIRVK